MSTQPAILARSLETRPGALDWGAAERSAGEA